MGRKVELQLKKEDALHISKHFMNWDYLSEESQIHQVQTLFNDGMYDQTNVRGRDWYRTFEYLKAKGYDLSIYNEKL